MKSSLVRLQDSESPGLQLFLLSRVELKLDRFWERGVKTATPSSQRHFVEAFTDYLNSVVEQAKDRDDDYYRTIDEYLKNRRENIGARPSYVPAELGLDLPDEAFYHPVIQELSYHIADLIILGNVRTLEFRIRASSGPDLRLFLQDIASYNKEQANGDDRHNIITIAMHQFNTDFEGAMDWVLQYHEEVETKFLDGLKRVPSFGPKVDEQIQEYITALAIWPRCNDCWNFESGRYFGDKGLEIQNTRYVQLLPKFNSDPTLKRDQVVVPLVEL